MEPEIENICYSGGADGADNTFGALALLVGHKVKHFSFRGAKTKWPHKENLVILSPHELALAEWDVRQANGWIKRTYPTSSPHTNSLLERNWYQIKDTNRIYAVGTIGERGIPNGGTAWAVIMGMLRQNVLDIYFFDQGLKIWFKFQRCSTKDKEIWWFSLSEKNILKPFGKYTGIGTRNLTTEGLAAIEKLYMPNAIFEVHATQGQGGFVAGSFYTLEQALHFSEETMKTGVSVRIKKPDGSWHKFEKEYGWECDKDGKIIGVKELCSEPK